MKNSNKKTAILIVIVLVLAVASVVAIKALSKDKKTGTEKKISATEVVTEDSKDKKADQKSEDKKDLSLPNDGETEIIGADNKPVEAASVDNKKEHRGQ